MHQSPKGNYNWIVKRDSRHPSYVHLDHLEPFWILILTFDVHSIVRVKINLTFDPKVFLNLDINQIIYQLEKLPVLKNSER